MSVIQSVILSIVLFLGISSLNAQFSVPGVFLDMRYPTWNKDSIKAYHIQSISVKILDKPSSRTINDKGNRLLYEFDKRGNLIAFKKVFRDYKGKLDTSSIAYSYDGDRLKSQLEILGSYQRKTEYETIDDHTKNQTISVKRGTLAWQVISVEKVETQPTKSGEVVRIGGIDAMPYQSTDVTRNELGQLTSRDIWNGKRLLISEHWSYGRKGSVHYTKSNAQGKTELSVLLARETGSWCVNDVCRNWSVVYDKHHREEGWIFMNSETQDAEIWEFDYKFYFSESLTEGR